MFVEPEVLIEEAVAKRDTADSSPAELPVFVARPKEETAVKRPALLLIQEAFGVNGHIRDVCQRYARQGYVVVSPDLYYRTSKWMSIDYTDFASTQEPRAALTADRVIGDLGAALDYITQLQGVDTGRIGVLGYCMGGRLSYVTVSQFPDRVKAGAVYYGGGIVMAQPDPNFPIAPIDWTERIKAPVIAFFGGKDQGIPVSAVESIDQALEKAQVQHEVYLYPDAGHGFFCDNRASFHPRAAEDAWHRTLNWFEQHLGAPAPVRW